MNRTVEQATRPLLGRVVVPGDKSVSHRAFLVNALGRGQCRIRGALDSDDVACSRALVTSMGVGLVRDGADWLLTAGDPVEPPDVIDCGNSGTTMRIGAGVLAHAPGLRVLNGDDSLRRRPMARILEPLRTLGVDVMGREGGRFAPIGLLGRPRLRADLSLPVASAQVKSAILLAARDVGVTVREPRQSRDHTERMLLAMGADLSHDERGSTLQPGEWSCVDVDVPGDLSSAAFWLAAGCLVPGSRLVLPGVGMNPTRDGVVRALQAMGADIALSEMRTDGVEPTATVTVSAGPLHGTRIDGDLALSCLDELPVLAVCAAMADGPTVIADAAELRVKESDRIRRVVDGLVAMGAQVEERPDGMVVSGGGFRGSRATIDARGDHRLAMAFAVAGCVHPSGVELRHADSVRTSYPSFFQTLDTLLEDPP